MYYATRTMVSNDRTKPHLLKKLQKMGHCCKSWNFWASCKLLLNAFGVWTPQSSAPFQRLLIPITLFLEIAQIPQCVLFNVYYLLLTWILSFMGTTKPCKKCSRKENNKKTQAWMTNMAWVSSCTCNTSFRVRNSAST